MPQLSGLRYKTCCSNIFLDFFLIIIFVVLVLCSPTSIDTTHCWALQSQIYVQNYDLWMLDLLLMKNTVSQSEHCCG